MRIHARIIAWSLLVVCSLGSSCVRIPAVQGAEGAAVEVRDLLAGLDGLRNNSVYRDEILTNIDNSGKFAAAWAELTSRLRPAPPVPVVDFGREWVLIYSPGQQKTGGHRLRLVPVRDQSRWEIEHLLPGAGCIATSQLTSPVLVLAVPVAVQSGRISVVTRRVDCS